MSDVLAVGDGLAVAAERDPEGTWTALDSAGPFAPDADALSCGFGHVYEAARGHIEECVLATYQKSYRSLDHPARLGFRARVLWNVARRLTHWDDDAMWDEIVRLDEWFPPFPPTP